MIALRKNFSYGGLGVDTDRIPNSLNEAIAMLLADIDAPAMREIRKLSEESFRTKQHRRTGTWIRNSWSLWTDSALKQWFEARGVFHPDDMTGVIFRALHRTICDKPINLKSMVAEYKAHWKLHAPNTIGGMCGVWHCSCSRLIAKCKCGEKEHQLTRIVTKGCPRCQKSISRKT